MAIKRNLRNQLKNNKQDESDINDEVEAALLLWLLTQAPKQSEFIISTTQTAIQEEILILLLRILKQMTLKQLLFMEA